MIDLLISQGLIESNVQGSRPKPYRVRIATPAVDAKSWDVIAESLVTHAGISAQMLAGHMPHEIEEVFTAAGVALFPRTARDLNTECTCPDWANPCKHVAAVCYLVAEAFDRDPFLVLSWRGRDREALLAHLRELRGDTDQDEVEKSVAPIEQEAVRALADCVVGFWKAGPELSGLRIWPKTSDVPGALLRQMPTRVIEVRGRDLTEVLQPGYEKMAHAAERRAFRSVGSP